MRIIRIETFAVIVPMQPGTVHSPAYEDSCHQFDWKGKFFADVPKYIYKVWADDGSFGLGESYREVSEELIQRNIRLLLGQDPMKMNLRQLPIPPGREYDGFEVAIYDLVAGKLGVPVYTLLGGACRDRVRVDYWTGRRTPSEAAAIAGMAKERGFRGLKMKCALEDPNVERVEEIAARCGPDFEIVLDPNQRFEHPAHALRIARRVEKYKVTFEDPVPRWNLDWYRLLREKTSVPIALHVHLPYAAHGQSIREMIAAIKLEAVDIFNLGGGLASFVKMADIADAAGIPVWHGTEVDLGILDASYLHACAAAPACTLPSDIIGNFLREDDLIAEPLRYDQGFALVPQTPGLGVTLDEDALARYTLERRVYPQ
ncbi:MAG TPA: mandelate racemase/muconate lactonizing enzyme family protein [Bryobacteraceae bacterium]|nr:mandelate racemase/muconate lactonizing enzyme family protein [Bryobacteraceae bacterium]